ncbi:DNA cytosine methyltransferase [Tenacibaculum singaporense]|uniref:DNA (cytosine-5-)-methyltransferase n=1 Tax=Tenacibaculum singaporense TaxID=2358479 RepID=A0A3S8R667_9FLAO|nr:DNA cytosine methyltransferase [Tenacibaculum singaporense]AZJ35254.1 DNA cytosine methyltransferase [Tenacibaculum singaporense]
MKNAIDIFSGAGGMSIGACMAGIKIDLAIEFNSQAADTFKFNHPDTEVICEDIREVNIKDSYKRPFILFGGPPCQGFSISNTKTRNINNSNNSLFKEFVRMVKESKPKWFVFENVEGFVTFQKGSVLKQLCDEFALLGYSTSYKILKASDYGVPQNRNRFFMVGNNVGVDFSFPETNNIKVTVKQAISDLPNVNNGDVIEELPYKMGEVSEYAQLMRVNSNKSRQNFVSKNQDYVIERYKHISVGENWKSIPEELMKNYSNRANCHSGIYRRLHPDRPSVVIANYRKNMLIHPYEDRGLSVREAARLQSFPDNFIFKGSLMHIQQQIGNAVPPLLAKAVFEQIIELNEKNNL